MRGTLEPALPDEIAGARIARRRQLRLRMLAIVAASYAIDAGLLALYAAAGTTTIRIAILFAVVASIILTGFALTFRSKVGERAVDPFLSIWQMLAAIAAQLVFLTVAPEVGIVFLWVLFVVFGFGALRLQLVQAWWVWALTAAGVMALLGPFGVRAVIPLQTPAERWITAFGFMAALGRSTAIGLLGGQYRERLSERTRELGRLTADLEAQVASRTRDLARANQALERLVDERTTEIKTLQGVLPICSHCKKIRDDKGAWNQLEAYISGHTEVLFSHGICGECLSAHHAEVD